MGLDVHQLIGRRPEEVAWVDLVGLPLPPPSEIDEIRTYHAFPGLGFELISEPPDVGAARVVVSIMLYSGRDRTDGVRRGRGDVRHALRRQLPRHGSRSGSWANRRIPSSGVTRARNPIRRAASVGSAVTWRTSPNR